MSDDNFKCSPDIGNCRPTFSISVRLCEMLDDFSKCRLAFEIAGRLWPKAADNSQLLSDFLKRRPTIVISVRLWGKSSNTGRSSPNECPASRRAAFCAPPGVFLLHLAHKN